jgi:hypothetical protein
MERDDETCESCGSMVDWRGDWEPGLLCDDCKVEDLELKNTQLTKRVAELENALKTAAIRMEILTGRMRGCHEETGKHELLDEAEAFCKEAREVLGTQWKEMGKASKD